MNLRLTLLLSLFGLAMAFATVSLIPEKVEFVFWVVIFIICGYVLAKAGTGKYFLNGFMISIFNCIWITIVHYLFYNSYTAHHPDMAAMPNNMGYFTTHPRQLMLIAGPIFGVVFGVVQGLFALVIAKIVKPGTKAVA